jgi:hypothetical protein
MTTTATFLHPWTSRSRSTGRLRMADDLNREWRRLDTDPRSIARATGWQILPPVERLDLFLTCAGYGGPSDDITGDRVLSRLVAVARGDELAARVVLQRILPGLISTAVRRGRIAPGGPVEAFGELVAVSWEVIRAYPIERRPERVAANLLRDVEYQAFVRPQRRLTLEVRVGDLESAFEELCVVEADVDPGGRSELQEVIDWARRRGVDAAHIDLLRRVGAGGSSAEIARALRCTERTVRNRRRTAMEEVRRAYAEVAA